MDNYDGPHNGEEGYYGSQKLYHKSYWQRYRWFFISIGSLVILVAILTSIIFYLLPSRTQATNTSSSSPNVPSQTGSVNTPAPSTSGPGTAATPTVLATVADGKVTEPDGGLKLHTNADDPITVTITSMTYHPAENKMVWDLVFKNISSSDRRLYSADFTLKSDAEGDNYTHQAQASQTYINIPSGIQVQDTVTFTFVPYQKASGVSYTLTSSIHDDSIGTITFDPIPMTF